jgi:hypothetical protein
MNELFEALKPAILEIIGIIGSAVGVWVAVELKRFIASRTSKVNNEIVKLTIEQVVTCVEQIGKMWGSDQKLADAKARALKILSEKGLSISETELNTLIEATVQEFYAHWKEEETPVVAEPVLPEGVEVTE